MSAGDRQSNIDEPAGIGVRQLLRRPSAFVPMVLSLAALAVVAGHIAIAGTARETDEGAAAHLWQLLMAAQIPFLLVFAAKWLPQAPKPALAIMAGQIAAAAAAVAPVFFLAL